MAAAAPVSVSAGVGTAIMKLVYAAASTLPAGHLHVCMFVDHDQDLGCWLA